MVVSDFLKETTKPTDVVLRTDGVSSVPVKDVTPMDLEAKVSDGTGEGVPSSRLVEDLFEVVGKGHNFYHVDIEHKKNG